MNLYPDSIFHICNRGNNSQTIFFSRDNYLYFLDKVRQYLLDECDFLAYCLMPNHFHFMINTLDNFDERGFSEQFRIMLSSYTRAINKQENRSGSLFQQNTHSINLIQKHENHAIACFHYIHQNPLRARLVTKMEDWEFSSFRDYCGIRKGTLCNQNLACELFDLPIGQQEFYRLALEVIPEDRIQKIL